MERKIVTYGGYFEAFMYKSTKEKSLNFDCGNKSLLLDFSSSRISISCSKYEPALYTEISKTLTDEKGLVK